MQKITKRANGDLHVETINEEPSLTQQQFKEDCDINVIMEKYHQTGILPAPQLIGTYADLTQQKDYLEAMQIVLDANAAFMTLPVKTRIRFDNDPAQLLAFVHDEKNLEEAIKLGLANPKTPQVSETTTIPTPEPEIKT